MSAREFSNFFSVFVITLLTSVTAVGGLIFGNMEIAAIAIITAIAGYAIFFLSIAKGKIELGFWIFLIFQIFLAIAGAYYYNVAFLVTLFSCCGVVGMLALDVFVSNAVRDENDPP